MTYDGGDSENRWGMGFAHGQNSPTIHVILANAVFKKYIKI